MVEKAVVARASAAAPRRARPEAPPPPPLRAGGDPVAGHRAWVAPRPALARPAAGWAARRRRPGTCAA